MKSRIIGYLCGGAFLFTFYYLAVTVPFLMDMLSTPQASPQVRQLSLLPNKPSLTFAAVPARRNPTVRNTPSPEVGFRNRARNPSLASPSMAQAFSLSLSPTGRTQEGETSSRALPPGTREIDSSKKAYYLKAIERDPNSARLRTDYARFLFRVLRDFSEAERQIQISHELDPENENTRELASDIETVLSHPSHDQRTEALNGITLRKPLPEIGDIQPSENSEGRDWQYSQED